MDISFIIVSWNTRQLLLDCLFSIRDTVKGFEYEVFVVDNGSTDGSQKAVREQFGAMVHLIENTENQGFARAKNQAIKLAAGRYVILLNSDTVLLDNTVNNGAHTLTANRSVGIQVYGYGSYTTYEYSNLALDKKVKADGTLHLSVDIKNTGTRDGEEVVQVYVRDEKASMLRPGLELAGFKRVGLKAGETRKIHFQIKADQFAFLDVDMKWIVEAGKMTVKVGSSSEDIRLSDSFEIEDTAFIVGKNRGFFARTMAD